MNSGKVHGWLKVSKLDVFTDVLHLLHMFTVFKCQPFPWVLMCLAGNEHSRRKKNNLCIAIKCYFAAWVCVSLTIMVQFSQKMWKLSCTLYPFWGIDCQQAISRYLSWAVLASWFQDIFMVFVSAPCVCLCDPRGVVDGERMGMEFPHFSLSPKISGDKN